jgi:diadenylate cyclase
VGHLPSLWRYLVPSGATQTLVDLVDIALVSCLIYYLLRLIRGRRALAITIGVLVVVIVSHTTQFLPTVNWLVKQATLPGVIALIILFQPELRSMLERLGRSGLRARGALFLRSEDRAELITELVEAATSLSHEHMGALIAVEREADLGDITRTGCFIDAAPSHELLCSLFFPRSALHDGAVVVSGNRLVAAACTLPSSEQYSLPPSLGLRHRGAIGLSERTDAVVVVVSEQSGRIALAVGGTLYRDLDRDSLRERLTGLLHARGAPASGWAFWRRT